MTVDHLIKLPHNVSFFHLALKVCLNFASTVEAQREMEKMKADKEECRAIHKKKAVQKANQQAGKETDSEDEFEPRANPLVNLFVLMSIIF